MTVAVLGGGISGLASAYYLKLNSPTRKVILIEASNRLGGFIHSVRNKDGIIYERGPRTLRVFGNSGLNCLALANSLQLSNEVIFTSQDSASTKNRMIQVGGKLHKLPNNLKSILSKNKPFSRPIAYYLVRELISKKIVNHDESLFSFCNRRFGWEVASYMVDPLARGIYAGNAKDLSVMTVFKQLHEMEQKHGSVLKGFIKDIWHAEEKCDQFTLDDKLVQRAKTQKWAVWSLVGGLETLVEALTKSLVQSGVEIHMENAVTALVSVSGGLCIKTKKGNIEVEKVVSSLPAQHLKTIVAPLVPELSVLLSSIPYASVAVVSLEYCGKVLKESAFGYLVPSCESNKVLGVVFDTCIFPQGDRTIVTVMIGGVWFDHLFKQFQQNSNCFIDIAKQEVRTSLNITAAPLRHCISILPNCIPQYVVGHTQTVNYARHLLHDINVPLILVGTSFDGIGVNDAIFYAKKWATNI